MRLRSIALRLILVLAVLTTPLAAEAKGAGTGHRIALVNSGASTEHTAVGEAFRQGLREHGYVVGRNLTIEYRGAELKPERFPGIMAELVELGVEVIALPCGAGLDAAREATQTIPVVGVACNVDLVKSGIVASLARPGGNITAVSKLASELARKRLELLTEVVAEATRVAVLWDPSVSDFSTDWAELRTAAGRVGVTLESVEFRGADELDRAFAAMAEARVPAFITFSDPTIYFSPGRVVTLAAQHRLPGMYAFTEVPAAGGLMSYGPNILDLVRRSGHHVAKILNGAKPADLPVEQPTKFDLWINLKTARALGLTIPPSLLLRADQMIE